MRRNAARPGLLREPMVSWLGLLCHQPPWDDFRHRPEQPPTGLDPTGRHARGSGLPWPSHRAENPDRHAVFGRQRGHRGRGCVLRLDHGPLEDRFTRAKKIQAFREAWLLLVIIIGVLCGIFAGFFTPTSAGINLIFFGIILGEAAQDRPSDPAGRAERLYHQGRAGGSGVADHDLQGRGLVRGGRRRAACMAATDHMATGHDVLTIGGRWRAPRLTRPPPAPPHR